MPDEEIIEERRVKVKENKKKERIKIIGRQKEEDGDPPRITNPEDDTANT